MPTSTTTKTTTTTTKTTTTTATNLAHARPHASILGVLRSAKQHCTGRHTSSLAQAPPGLA